MPSKSLVLDANILIRAVLGSRVRRVIQEHSDTISFFVPDSAYREAEGHLAALVIKRGGDPEGALRLLHLLRDSVELVSEEFYQAFEQDARARIGVRDPNDWPILACALALGCPIWTEDVDFFGCGVATWTSGRIEVFLKD